MYKKYIKRRGKLTGPYYYESVRLKNGKIKTVYVGRNPDSLDFKNKIALLRVQDAVSKGESVVIPVEPGDVVHRPKRPDYLKPDLNALKEYFGETFSKIKSNIVLPKFNLPKLDIPNLKLPKVTLPKFEISKVKTTISKLKLPEFKTAEEVMQRKLEEFVPKPGLHDFDFHAALTILLSVIFVFGFFFLQNNFVGYSTILNESLLDELGVGQLGSEASSNLSEIVQESSAIPLVLNILNYSCSWNGTSFRVCESVEWSGGSYAKGYISGGDSIKDAEAFANSPFTYCQDLDKEGKKAVNAYIFDESDKIIKQDLTNKVECIIGNNTLVEISNESVEQNITNETANITESYGYEVNSSGTLKRIVQYEEQVNGAVEQTIQYPAVVGQPVKWKKVIKLENETSNLTLDLPKNSKVLSIKEIENESVKDITEEVLTPNIPLTGLSFLLTGLAIADEVNTTSLIIEQSINEVEIEYETEAPQLYEEELDNGVRLTLSSNTHYQNVYAEITVPESRGELIRLYWIVNETRVLHPIIDYDDNNFDGLIDEIAFVAPHLSTETFELIYITKAEHLDENYSFISDIYNETVELDDTWSEKIYHSEYVRVTFEENLTSEKDITVYARTNSTNTTIEVYYYNSTSKITEFPVIAEEDYYKVFLNGMNENESYGTFDLRIKNLEEDVTAYLEFDQIIDPTVLVINGGNEAHDIRFSVLNSSIGQYVTAWCDDTDDSANFAVYYVNGTREVRQEFNEDAAGDSCRIGVSAFNETSFAIAYIDFVSSSSDWIVIGFTSSNNSQFSAAALDSDMNEGVDVGVCALNSTQYATVVVDALDDDATYAILDLGATKFGPTDIDSAAAPDAGCQDQSCAQCAALANNGTQAGNGNNWVLTYYDDSPDAINYSVRTALSGAIVSLGDVAVSATSGATSVAGLYNGGFVIAYCDNSQGDVSFRTYDAVGTAAYGPIDVNATVGAQCGGAIGTKVAVAALNTTDSQFVVVWDDARVNQTSFAVYNYSRANITTQTIIDEASDTAEKAVGTVGWDAVKNTSVCDYAPLPIFVVGWNNGTGAFSNTYLNNGSQYDGDCAAPVAADTTPPSNVTLINPPNNTINRSSTHKFIANITDNSALNNATLYHNISGTWEANQTATITGTNNQTNFTVNLIVDGGYTWYVLSCDTDNNCNQSSVNFTFTVDSSRPSNINLTMPPNNAANRSTTWLFESNASDSYSGLVNASLYHNISGTWGRNQTVAVTGTSGVKTQINVSNIADGTYSWNFEWCDAASNCNQSNTNFTFIVDTIRPASVNISSPPNNTFNRSTTWRFDSNATDNVSLANATLYHNISGSWEANQTVTVSGSSGVVTSINVSNVADGGYTWNFQWCDYAGNCNQSNFNFTFFVDSTLPSNVNLTTPPNNVINTSRSWLFNSNASDARALANVSLYHNISGSWIRNQTNNVNGTTNSTNFTVNLIVDGGYTWNVEWCDEAGNCNQSNTNRTFTINNPPRDVNLVSPPNETYNRSTTWRFDSNASDDRQLFNATLYHNINGTYAGNQTITRNGTTNTSNFSVANIADGTYIWNVFWCDTETNCSFSTNATGNFTFTVDTTRPSNVTLINPPNGTYNVTTTHKFVANITDALTLANATLYHNINGTYAGNQSVDFNGSNNQTNFTVANIADGSYTWNVFACDLAGNCNWSHTNFTFTVDNGRPSNITLINPPNNTVNKSTTHKFVANITDALGIFNATLFHNISGSFVANQTVNLNGTNNQTNFTINLIVVGGYSWYVLACDEANNCNQSSFNFTFEVDDIIPPTVNLINPPNASINTSRSYTFFGNTTDNRILDNATLYHNETGTFTANATTTSPAGTFSNWSINVSGFNDTGLIWNILVCDTANNCNWSNFNRTLTVNNFPSGVNLTNPPNATSNRSRSHVFFSNATDIRQLANATLYHNISGTWAINQTVTRNGTTNTSSFNVNLIPIGTYDWNVLWCDTEGNCSFSTSNNSLTVANSIPTITSVDINTTNPTQNGTLETIKLYVRGTADDDGDLVQNISNWYANGTSIAVINLPFEKNFTPSSGFLIKDYSSRENNATIFSGNVTWTSEGVRGGAYVFNQSSTQRISINLNKSLFNFTNRAFTVAVWVNASEWTTGGLFNYIFSDEDSVSPFYGITLRQDSGLVSFVKQSTIAISTGTANLSTGDWHLIVAWFNGSNMRLYTDGVLRAETVTDKYNVTLTNNFTIGAHPSTNGRSFNGTIDEVLMFNRSLTSEEIAALNTSFGLWDTIAGYETKPSENWTACVTPNDGTTDGVTVCSINQTVNARPNISRVDINSTDPTNNNTRQNLTIYPRTVTDPDGNLVQNISNWYVNGTSLTVLNLPFETNMTPTAANLIRDYSGYENNASVSTGNVTHTPNGRRGGAYVFNASSTQRIKIIKTDSTNLTNPFTITMWINASEWTTSAIHYLMADEAGSPFPSTIIRKDSASTTLSFLLFYNGGLKTVSTNVTANVSAGKWHFMAFWFNGSQHRIYSDGVLRASTNGGFGDVRSSNQNWTIGAHPSVNGRTFNGTIDEVMIFNRSLTDEQILLLNNSDGLWETIFENETVAGENWSACVTVHDATIWGNTVCSENVTIASDNTAPNITIGPHITPVSPNTTDTLNCSFVVTDPDGSLNANVTFFRDDVVNYSINVTFTNGLNASATLPTGRQNKGESWLCQVRPFDGTVFGITRNSSARTVVNSAPEIPYLDQPPNHNVTTNRSPYFNWSDTTDADFDPVNYTLNITCRGGCASDTRIINVVNRTNFTLTDDLEFFADDGFNYTWTVLATDGELNSSYNESLRNLSIYTLVDLSIPSGNVSFGSMTLGATNDTDDNSPSPFRIQNNGNILINISINATSLWDSDPSPTSNYQYKIDNVSGENNSFVWGSSNTSYTNVPIVDNVAIVGLNHTDVTDSCQVDISITVPSNEGPANRTSTVLFRGAR